MKCRNDTEGEREKEMSDDLSLVSEISEEIEERDATRREGRGRKKKYKGRYYKAAEEVAKKERFAARCTR